MRHRTTPRVWEHYRSLPNEVRELADKNFRLLQSDPRHPSLQFKKVGTVWSARVGLAHRVKRPTARGGDGRPAVPS
jgi:hypothetical protein